MPAESMILTAAYLERLVHSLHWTLTENMSTSLFGLRIFLSQYTFYKKKQCKSSLRKESVTLFTKSNKTNRLSRLDAQVCPKSVQTKNLVLTSSQTATVLLPLPMWCHRLKHIAFGLFEHEQNTRWQKWHCATVINVGTLSSTGMRYCFHQCGNTVSIFHMNEVLMWEHCLYLPQEWGTAVIDVGTLSLSTTGMTYCCHRWGNTVSIFHRNEVLLSLMWEHCLYLPQEWGTAVIDVGTLSLFSTGMRYCCHRCGHTVSIFHRNEVLQSSVWEQSLPSTGMMYCSHWYRNTVSIFHSSCKKRCTS